MYVFINKQAMAMVNSFRRITKKNDEMVQSKDVIVFILQAVMNLSPRLNVFNTFIYCIRFFMLITRENAAHMNYQSITIIILWMPHDARFMDFKACVSCTNTNRPLSKFNFTIQFLNYFHTIWYALLLSVCFYHHR